MERRIYNDVTAELVFKEFLNDHVKRITETLTCVVPSETSCVVVLRRHACSLNVRGVTRTLFLYCIKQSDVTLRHILLQMVISGTVEMRFFLKSPGCLV